MWIAGEIKQGNDWSSQLFIKWAADVMLLDVTQLHVLQELVKMCAAEVTLLP